MQCPCFVSPLVPVVRFFLFTAHIRQSCTIVLLVQKKRRPPPRTTNHEPRKSFDRMPTSTDNGAYVGNPSKNQQIGKIWRLALACTRCSPRRAPSTRPFRSKIHWNGEELRCCTRLRFESAAEATSLTDLDRLARVATAFAVIMHSFDVPDHRCLAVELTSLCAQDERRISQQKGTQPNII